MASIQAKRSPYVVARRSLDTTDQVTDADQGEGKESPHSGSSATSDREAREAEQIAQELQVGHASICTTLLQVRQRHRRQPGGTTRKAA